MKRFSHEDQRRIWEEEHKNPNVLFQMDSDKPSSGVVKFFEYIKSENVPHKRGVEMGCGKGRNVIWLAENGVDMYGFDFSTHAIEEARRRATRSGVASAHFAVQDAMEKWSYGSGYFDFAIDCFASTDIESPEGREFAIREFYRVLKKGGVLLVYVLSIDDEFHKEMIHKNPAQQSNAFHHPTGKFEKTFDQDELEHLYNDFKVLKRERLHKMTQFGDKKYMCHHFWWVLQKQ